MKDVKQGFTFTVWPNELGVDHLSPAPNATKNGLMRFLKLIGWRKSSSHMTRVHPQLALDHQCHPLPSQGRVGVAPLQAPKRRKVVELEDVAGTDITMMSSLIDFMVAVFMLC